MRSSSSTRTLVTDHCFSTLAHSPVSCPSSSIASDALVVQQEWNAEERHTQMKNTYKAVEVSSPGLLRVVERPVSDPGAGQVRIRVEACGICHTDVGTVTGSYPGLNLPRVPGHEVDSDLGSCRRSEEHTSELQSPDHLVCRLLLEKKKTSHYLNIYYYV